MYLPGKNIEMLVPTWMVDRSGCFKFDLETSVTGDGVYYMQIIKKPILVAEVLRSLHKLIFR